MDYIGAHENINWLFILASLSVLQWVLTFIFVIKHYNKIGNKIKNTAFSGADGYKKRRVAFSKDYFYMYWNIYPIIFYVFFYYIDTSWETYMNQIIMIGGDRVRELYELFFKEFIFLGIHFLHNWIDTFVLIIGIFIAYFFGLRTQIAKQEQYKRERKTLYWWDIRISSTIYWIRFIFLFFNMILVAFIAYLMTKVAIFILLLLSPNEIIFQINPYHPDHFGGLRVLMEISSVILAIYLLRGMLGIVGLLDHKDVKGFIQKAGDLYHFAYFFLGTAFILIFTYRIDKILSNVKIDNLLSSERFKQFTITDDMNISEIIDKASDLSNYYGNLLQFNKTPIDLSLFVSSIFTFILPLSLWFVFGFIEDNNQQKK